MNKDNVIMQRRKGSRRVTAFLSAPRHDLQPLLGKLMGKWMTVESYTTNAPDSIKVGAEGRKVSLPREGIKIKQKRRYQIREPPAFKKKEIT